jgi:hypothetical protein
MNFSNHLITNNNSILYIIVQKWDPIVRIIRDQKSKQWHLRRISRFYHELLSRKEHTDMPIEALVMPRFTMMSHNKKSMNLKKQNKSL